MHNHEPNELDQTIDRAIASYVDAEPSPGLEYRVRESVHRAAHRKSRLWWWAVATPLLATALLIALLHPTAKVGTPSSPQGGPIESTAAVGVKPGAPSLRSKGGTGESLHNKSRTNEGIVEKEFHSTNRSQGWLIGAPAQSSAATNSDLTLHDAALVTLARENPDQLRALFARTDPEPIAPVRIDEIEIKPITEIEIKPITTEELR